MVKDLNDPTNVDSVPAMLTPGEYVLNKEASAMYGPLLEKMNNAGLQQRHTENQQVVSRNMGGPLMSGYNTGGLVGFIKEEEGWRNKAYQDPGGVWTIGYGRTRNPDGSAIKPGQSTSREKEDSWLTNRVNKERAAVKRYGKEKGYDWNDSQVNALASFRYNGGQGMLEQVTAGGKRDNDTIASKILEYNKQNIDGQLTPLAGLTKRRQSEASMFTGGNVPHTEQPQQAPQAQVAEAQPQQQSPIADFGGQAIQALMGQQQAPLQHSVSRQMTQPEYIQSVAAQGISTQPMRDDMQRPLQQVNHGGMIHANDGWGVLDWLKKKAFAGEDPNQGYANLPQDQFLSEAQNNYNVPSMNMTPPMTNNPTVDVPVPPNSDEALLQGSSDQTIANAEGAVDSKMTHPIMAWENATQQDFLNNSIPTESPQLPEQAAYSTFQQAQAAQNDPSIPMPSPQELEQAQEIVASPYAQSSMMNLQMPSFGEADPTTTHPYAGFENYTQDEFIQEAQPKDLVPSAEEQAFSVFQNPDATPEEIAVAQETVAAGEAPDERIGTGGGQENVPWVQQKDTIKETIANLEVEDNPNVDGPGGDVTFNSAATGDLIAQGEQAVANPPEPGFLDKLKGSLSAAFKDMFNPDSLARACLLYTSPSPRDRQKSRMPSSA